MMTIGQRIRYARTLAGLTQGEVAKKLGIVRVNITQWESDTTQPGIDRLPALAELLSTTTDWLIDGVGIAPGPATGGQSQETRRPRQMAKASDEVKELDVRAGAGGGGIIDLVNITDDGGNQLSAEVVKDYWRIPESFLRGELRVEASRALIIEVTGDSGYDPANPHAPGSVFPGDRVIVDAGDIRPSPPGPFLVYDGTGLVVKLCEPVHGSDPPTLRLLSRNPTYTPYTIALDDGHVIVGRVRGRISAM